MKRVITLNIPGKPSGKARPRSTEHGAFYSPKAGTFEAKVSFFAQQEKPPLLSGPVRVDIRVTRKIPKSYTKIRRAGLGTYATGKPDGANVEAAVHDAFNGLVYEDDSQVAVTSFIRVWGEVDSTEIEVFQL